MVVVVVVVVMLLLLLLSRLLACCGFVVPSRGRFFLFSVDDFGEGGGEDEVNEGSSEGALLRKLRGATAAAGRAPCASFRCFR